MFPTHKVEGHLPLVSVHLLTPTTLPEPACEAFANNPSATTSDWDDEQEGYGNRFRSGLPSAPLSDPKSLQHCLVDQEHPSKRKLDATPMPTICMSNQLSDHSQLSICHWCESEVRSVHLPTEAGNSSHSKEVEAKRSP